MIRFLRELKTKPESYWIKRGEDAALKLFHAMAKRVPAYRDFLKKNKIRPTSIKKIEDFAHIPPVDKKNYLRAYPLEDLCWDGKLADARWTYSVTSGSTGEPFYFPRNDEQDKQYALSAELYLLNHFDIDKKSTLYIDGFAMGAWIGGLFTYSAIKILADRGDYSISIITPGINKQEIIKAIRALGKKYDQIIIGGYPPFIKDLVDEGIAEGIVWKDYCLKFIFSAEGFSESFRDYVVEHASLKNPYLDTLNHYGTVDLGTMSHETPLSILMRKMALKKPEMYSIVFSEANKLPTLTQYLPEMFYFEEVSGGLLCSSAGGIPLIRYDLKDHGGVFSFDGMMKKLLARGIDVRAEAKKVGIEHTIMNLPFVHIYERSDFSVSLYGGNVYPETIRNAIQESKLNEALTGKFTMLIKQDRKQNSYLEINAELKPRARESLGLRKKIQTEIVNKLLDENSEYRSSFNAMHEKVFPKIVCWPYEHPQYFRSGGKQKWVVK